MKSNKYLFLDGVRGWASFIVLLGHLTAGLFAFSIPAYANLKLLSDGSFAVLVFFVLSGLVLSSSHLETKEKVLLSVISRYFRLVFPILITSGIAYILLKEGFMLNHEVGSYIEATTGLVKHKEWIGNFYSFIPDFLSYLKFAFYDVFFQYQGSLSYNPPLWTMSRELIGSYLIYIYIYFFHHSKKSYLRSSCIGLALLLIKNTIGCFMLGYIAARIFNDYLWVKKYMVVNYLSVLVFAISLFIMNYARPDNGAIVGILAFIIILSIGFSDSLRKIFESKISSFLGQISFKLYLIHIPIICSLTSYFYLHTFIPAINKIVAANVIILATILICIFSAFLLIPFEKLAIEYSKKIAKKILNVLN